MPTDTPPIPASLATTHCPNCGYALEGLPSAGTCPECGRGYDQSLVILYGFARGRHESVANAKASRIVWVVLGSMLGWFGWMEQAIFTFRWIVLLIPIGLAAAVAAYQWSRRRTSDHPGLIQVRLDANGCIQLDDLAGPSELRDLFMAWGWVAGPVVACATIAFYWRGELETGTFWVAIAMAAVYTPLMWWIRWHFRARMRAMRDGVIADAGTAYAEPTPWAKIGVVSMLPLKDDRYRLRLNTRNRFWTLTHEVVDAEIRCTLDQARELRQLIDDWVAQARQSTGKRR